MWPRIHRRFCALLKWGILLLFVQTTQANTGTFQDSLTQAITIFQTGDYLKAHSVLSDLEENFGEEPEYAEVERIILPLYGYSSLIARDYEKTIEVLECFIQTYPNQTKQQRLVFFSLAQAYQSTGQFDKALNTYEQFIKLSPNTPEAAMSIMRQAELHFQKGDHDAGIVQLLDLSNSKNTPESLRKQARLRALQQSQLSGDTTRSLDIMFEDAWSITAMPELAILTFAALRAGDDAISQKRYTDAIRAYRLVPPRNILIAAQEAKLEQLKSIYSQRQKSRQAGSLALNSWDEHYRVVINRVAAQLESLKASEDYTPSFLLRLGQAFLLSGRLLEAQLTFEKMSDDESLPLEIQVQAHYHRVLTANAFEDWEASIHIAQSFVKRFPDHTLAPQTLFLITMAQQQQKNYSNAVALLTELLDKYPEHPLAPRWLFTRGLNHCFKQDYDEAREDFRLFESQFPKNLLKPNAQLWTGLTFFFEKDYSQALSLFDALLENTPSSHPLYPEIQYRKANTLYASKEHNDALTEIESFLKKYSSHPRQPEAVVLRGDILLAKGRLGAAAKAFAEVTPEAGALFGYAVFQVGKIHRARENYDAMIEHFEKYVARDDVPAKVRIAEALYWVGWAYTQKQALEKAFPVFINALEKYGNDLEAGEVSNIFSALQKLHQQYHRGEIELSTDSLSTHPILITDDFVDWLKEEAKQALAQKHYTYYSRIHLYLAKLYDKAKKHDLSDVTILSIIEHVPDDALDAEGLAQVARILEEAGLPSAETYCRQLIDRYPKSPQRAIAYYGLARFKWKAQEVEATEKWLNRFLQETPFHASSTEVKLLMSEVLAHNGKLEKAIQTLEDLLRLKSARGRPHAQALIQLAQIHRQDHDLKKAVAYYQRVFTLYPAYRDLAATAYLQSALLFESLGEIESAYKTVEEMLSVEGMEREIEYVQAKETKTRLESLLPVSASNDVENSTNTEVPL